MSINGFTGRHPSVAHFEPLFEFGHLPPHLAEISAEFADVVGSMLAKLPVDGPELSAGLRKLVEAKDCFVRHAVLTAADMAGTP